MGFENWHGFYTSDLQAVYGLLILPGAFLLYWLWTAPRRLSNDAPVARFLRLYTLVFCIETLIDPIATGPVVSALGLQETGAALMGLVFVLLGDFRVFVLVFAIASPQRRRREVLREAVLWTPIVAVSAFALHAALDATLGVRDQLLWMIHEILFVAIALVLRVHVIARRMTPQDPNRRRLERVIDFVIVYYGLWAMSDALILFGGFDWGWGLRVVPNQLYYAVWIPFVYATFFEWSGNAKA